MSGRWFRFYADAMRNPKVARLNDRDYRRKLLAAMDGEENEFTPFLSGPFVRPDSGEWAILRAEVFARDDYTCTYCGAKGVALECDHIVPVSKGGDHDPTNLTTACKPCNRSKAGKNLADWRGSST